MELDGRVPQKIKKKKSWIKSLGSCLDFYFGKNIYKLGLITPYKYIKKLN